MSFVKDVLKTKTAAELDIDEHKEYIKRLLKFHKSTKFPFLILYNKLLDYNTNIATQTLISYIFDLRGNKLYEPNNLSTSIITRYFYLMVLPCKGKTRILFYIEKNSINYVKNIVEQFNELTEDEKLHFLFISLMIFEESFYMKPSLKEKIKKDKRITKLYTSTDNTVQFVEQREIQNFRKYNNYFLNQFGS